MKTVRNILMAAAVTLSLSGIAMANRYDSTATIYRPDP